MSDKRQKRQLELAFACKTKGEALDLARKGTESRKAENRTEHPAAQERVMEEVCEVRNLKQALRRVKQNGGSPGIDGRRVEELAPYLVRNWNEIRESLLNGRYRPQAVKRVEIAKPTGGTRLLGIPTVVDRFVQQAMLQVLQKRWEPSFSTHSHGFRPGRSAHQAVAEAQQHIAEGYRWVVDLDLEQFFDQVNHDRLMSRVAERVSDKRALKLIRRMLEAGVMMGGLVRPTEQGTPQGGPLSPLLSNIVLDELDQELERRGHRFVRYADDCNVYVRSERAGQRVMESLRRYITSKLRLRLNESKSAVAQPWNRKFLGFSFTNRKEPKRRIAPEAVMRFKKRVRGLTRPTCGRSIGETLAELNMYLNGWMGYFGFAQTGSVMATLNRWIRRRLRSLIWRQWRTWKRRSTALEQLGIDERTACRTAATRRGPWYTSNQYPLSAALSNSYFADLGLIELRVT